MARMVTQHLNNNNKKYEFMRDGAEGKAIININYQPNKEGHWIRKTLKTF